MNLQNIVAFRHQITALNAEIDEIAEKYENCGMIPLAQQQKIEQLNQQLQKLNQQLDETLQLVDNWQNAGKAASTFVDALAGDDPERQAILAHERAKLAAREAKRPAHHRYSQH